MKKASDVLCVLSILVMVFFCIGYFTGFFGLTQPQIALGVIVLIGVVIGGSLRLTLESEGHYVGAGVITLLFISTGVFGVISAILMFVYNSECYSPSENQTPSNSAVVTSKPKDKFEIYQDRIKDLAVRCGTVMSQKKMNLISEEDYQYNRALIIRDINEFNKEISTLIQISENRLNKGILTLKDYEKETQPLNSVIDQLNKVKSVLDGNEEVFSFEKPAEDVADEKSVQEEIANLEATLSLDENNKSKLESHKKYYEEGIYSEEEYLSKLKQFSSKPLDNPVDNIEFLQDVLEADETKKADFELYKNWYNSGIYSKEEYLFKLKELYSSKKN